MLHCCGTQADEQIVGLFVMGMDFVLVGKFVDGIEFAAELIENIE